MKTVYALVVSMLLVACGGADGSVLFDETAPVTEAPKVVDGGSDSPTVKATPDASPTPVPDAGSADAGPQEGGSCTENAATCNGTTALSCQGGKWVVKATCSGDAPVCDKGLCVVCSENEKSCVDVTPRTCVAGQWVYAADCSGTNNVCLDGNCAQCTPGQKRCTGAVPETCSANGTWQAKATCEGTASPTCDPSTAACVECLPGATQCSGLDSQTCSAGKKWVKAQTCQFACGGAGVCGVCQPNAVRCNGGGAETCNAAGQWYVDTSEVAAFSVCDVSCSGGAGFKVNDVTNTVLDTSTGLTWERGSKYVSPGTNTYTEAAAACTAKGMRLPTMTETNALRLPTCLWFDETAFPGFMPSNSGVWTSSTDVAAPGMHFVALDGSFNPDTTKHNVLCVK